MTTSIITGGSNAPIPLPESAITNLPADLAAKARPLGAWNSGTSFLTNDVVTRLGGTYRALVPNTGVDPVGNPATWESWGGGGGTSVQIVDLARDGTDQTSKLQAAINAAMADGKGWLVIISTTGANSAAVILGQITFPNNGANPPFQRSLKITGQGASHNGQGGAPYGGTILDLRYVGSATAGKIETRGLGHLTLESMTLMDSTDGTTDFIHSTNTTLDVTQDMEFYGKTGAIVGTATFPAQDAIVFGGTTTTLDGSATAAYQGYGSRVEGCHFNRIRRAVYGRVYCNGLTVRNNTVWLSCGANSTAAPFEFNGGAGGADVGPLLDGNIVEMGNYVYGVKCTTVSASNFGPNGFYDSVGTTLGYYWFAADATYNMVIDGMRTDTIPLIVENGASIGTNTQITAHQSQSSVFAQPVKFAKAVTFTGATGLSPVFAGGSGACLVQPGEVTSQGASLFQIKRSTSEATNPGTNVFSVTQGGVVTIGGTYSGTIIFQDEAGTAIASLTGGMKNWLLAGAGGSMLIDSGNGGSNIDVKAYNFRVIRYDTSAVVHQFGVPGIGVFGHAVAAQQTVTGSRAANAALASLITALAAYGIVVDSSTA